jgi:hypothetical protein
VVFFVSVVAMLKIFLPHLLSGLRAPDVYPCGVLLARKCKVAGISFLQGSDLEGVTFKGWRSYKKRG